MIFVRWLIHFLMEKDNILFNGCEFVELSKNINRHDTNYKGIEITDERIHFFPSHFHALIG